MADLNLAWASIGQHMDLVNPCAFLTFIGAVANDGKVTMPYLVEEISDLIRFASSARYTITERREIRDKALATLAKHGIVLDKADWMKWVNFMQWFKSTEYAALYDSDSDVVMDVFEQGSTAEEWERAFREWRANND